VPALAAESDLQSPGSIEIGNFVTVINLRFLAVIPVLALTFMYGVAAQPNSPSPALQPDPICGFIAGPHHYLEAAAVKQGLAVELLAGDVHAGQPVTLRFFVHDRPRNSPVEDLQVEHEKLMHVIGVREDLNEFFHVHPTKVAPGMWAVSHTFSKGGNYKIWTDVKSRGVTYSFGQPLLPVSGERGQPDSKPAATDYAMSSGYQVILNHAETLTAGKTNELLFSIRDAAGIATETENFLGASIHLVLVKDNLSEYLHAHPEGRVDGAVRFRQVFPTGGRYQAFAQFRPRNAKLAADQAILVKFRLPVQDAD